MRSTVINQLNISKRNHIASVSCLQFIFLFPNELNLKKIRTRSIESKNRALKVLNIIFINTSWLLYIFSFKFLGHIPNYCSWEENTRCPHPHKLKDLKSSDIHCPVSDATGVSGYSKNQPRNPDIRAPTR